MMFWNREDEPFTVRQDPDYPRVFIKMHGKDIDGYIEEDDLDYLDDKSKVFTVRAEREHPITRERIGVITGVSIKLVEENDWYMKIEHKCNVLYETQPNLLEIKLKDTDSVPEVWYRGERVDELPNGLVDAYMHWHTCEADKPTELMASLEYVEGTDIDAKRIEVYIDEEGERGSFNLLKDEIDD